MAKTLSIPKITVTVGKLMGVAQGDGSIIIDPRQCEKEMLATAIHEGLHVAFPELSEDEVIRAERIIAQVPWQLGFRLKKKVKN
jgi:hypothetical protein